MLIKQSYNHAMSPRTTAKTKTAQNLPNPEDIRIVLETRMGISPRIYVPAAWIIIIVSVVFLLLILPGIRRNGTWITFYTDPPGASIVVDGVRLGRSYQPVFVAKGERFIAVRRSGFEDQIIQRPVKGRIFASRIFPRREEISLTLKISNAERLISEAIRDYSLWSSAGTAGKLRYALPSSLTMLGRDAGKTPNANEEQVMHLALPAARDSRQLSDLFRMRILLSQMNVNPLSLSQFIASLAEEAESLDAVEGIAHLINEEERSALGISNPAIETINLSEAREVYQDIRKREAFPISTVDRMRFVSIPQLSAPVGDMEVMAMGDFNPRFGAYPVNVELNSFRISVSEISMQDFARFTRLNPYWSADNRDTLIQEGLADENYLSGWASHSPPSGREAYPVSDVSWYAAMAYCEWLSSKIFPDGEARIRLPSEYEWEVAARLNGVIDRALPMLLQEVDNADTGKIQLKGMSGNVREWSANPFFYNDNLFPQLKNQYSSISEDLLAELQRPVRGGAWIDSNLLYPAAARGSLRPFESSPVLGFRVVVASD